MPFIIVFIMPDRKGQAGELKPRKRSGHGVYACIPEFSRLKQDCEFKINLD
jgi:hypothetical protein